MHASHLTTTNPDRYLPSIDATAATDPLTKADVEEVMTFLGTRSLHTAYLTSLIRENGVRSTYNRGEFHCYRNSSRQLEGIALIGHATIIEALSDSALRAFAEVAQRCPTVHLIMCQEDRINQFWGFYTQTGQEMRRASRQLVFELRWPIEVRKPGSRLRLAEAEDLKLLLPVHAGMACDESGVDPTVVNAAGFSQRYARRIEQGRTWVSMEDGKLLFKAEVVSETPETTYIEGVWVNPEARRRGYGRSCMSQLARMLLWRTKSLCLSVNDENEAARAFFKQSGYHLQGVYDTIFLK